MAKKKVCKVSNFVFDSEKSMYQNGLELNKACKELMTSLGFVIATLEMMAKGDSEVKKWYDECGLSIRPKEKKNEKKDKVYLTADLIIDSWNKELTINGYPAYKVKGELRPKLKFTPFDVIKSCTRMYNEVHLEEARRKREAKKADKAGTVTEVIAPKAEPKTKKQIKAEKAQKAENKENAKSAVEKAQSAVVEQQAKKDKKRKQQEARLQSARNAA